MKIVQAFNQEKRETHRFSVSVAKVFATAKRRILVRAIMTAIVIFMIFGAITLVIWQGATEVAAGNMSGGTIAAFVLYGGLLAGAFGNLSEVYGDLLRAAGASERLGELLSAEPDIRAVAARHGPGRLVHFDTHTDTGHNSIQLCVIYGGRGRQPCRRHDHPHR